MFSTDPMQNLPCIREPYSGMIPHPNDQLQYDISSVAFRYQDQPMKERPALTDMDMLEIF